MEMVKKCEKYGRKINIWSGISIGVKMNIHLFSENIVKELYWEIMKKYLKEMKWKARNFFG